MAKIDLQQFFASSPTLKEVSDEFLASDDGEYARDMINAKKVLAALENAKQSGLQLEFLSFFINELCRGASYDEAIAYAEREWDL